ncbi:hypothetical protein ZWY2020_051047 [Hordeum vulgare]|nr:hypothetical protein ZWY2020_051047 [Hordeum vulgare]
MSLSRRRALSTLPSVCPRSLTIGTPRRAKERRRADGEEVEEGIRWFLPFPLGTPPPHERVLQPDPRLRRGVPATGSPLHFLLYRCLLPETWEYRVIFVPFIHGLVAGPASSIFGGEHKVCSVSSVFVRILLSVFYSVRIFLGLLSAITETILVVAISRRYGKRLASDYYSYGRWTSSVFNLLKYNMLGGGESHFGVALSARKKYAPDLLIVVSPVYIWLAFMSLQAHKEESIAKVSPLTLGFILYLTQRTFSMLSGYGAPLQIYQHLEYHEDTGPGSILCVGSEWHALSFIILVPSYISEVSWIDSGFEAFSHFPSMKHWEHHCCSILFQYQEQGLRQTICTPFPELKDIGACNLLMELDLKALPSRGSDLSTWETLASLPFLDRELSPALYRSFFIPYQWEHKNVFGLYKLLRRLPTDPGPLKANSSGGHATVASVS